MRTGEFIKQEYKKEIDRIIQEIEDTIPSIMLEKEIIGLQSKIKIHETLKDVYFNCSGRISFYLIVDGYKDVVALTIIPEGIRKSAMTDELTTENKYAFNKENVGKSLENFHIKELKKIHPKTWGEQLRCTAKQLLLKQD